MGLHMYVHVTWTLLNWSPLPLLVIGVLYYGRCIRTYVFPMLPSSQYVCTYFRCCPHLGTYVRISDAALILVQVPAECWEPDSSGCQRDIQASGAPCPRLPTWGGYRSKGTAHLPHSKREFVGTTVCDLVGGSHWCCAWCLLLRVTVWHLHPSLCTCDTLQSLE